MPEIKLSCLDRKFFSFKRTLYSLFNLIDIVRLAENFVCTKLGSFHRHLDVGILR